MRGRIVFYLLTALFLMVFAVFAGWAFTQGEHLGGGWGSLKPILIYVAGGLVAVALLTGGLMWLAFYSSRHGYDERVDDDPPQ